MGKPLGLLHRIFSFSKASKRSNTKFDLLQPADEHGRTHEHEDPLLAAGSIRTTGGIGGHGRGITNTASEMTPGKPLKDGERGMKKRRLKRASLSASNLLSWGQDRADKTERIPSNGSQDLVDKVSKGNEAGITTSTNERMHCGTPKASKHVESEDHEDNRSSSGRRESGRDEQFTRLLRSSSTNYKVISETDYRTLDPIDHPINALAFPRQSSDSQAPLVANPPSAWTPKSQARTLVFPPLHVPPALMHAPSVTSTTTASSYKVTVHRRRVHSRTSFPDANRALDHLHSTSSIDTPSTSSSPSPEPPKRARVAHSVETATETKYTKERPIQEVDSISRRSGHQVQRPAKMGATPSMIPRWSSVGHSDKGRNRVISQIYQPATVSQIHPVGPLRTVPPASQKGKMLASTEGSSDTASMSEVNTYDGTSDTSTAPMTPVDVPENQDNLARVPENAQYYTMPLKGADSSIDKAGQFNEGESIGGTSLAKSISSKTRNVLKKKRRASQESIATTREGSLRRANSVKSDKTGKTETASGKKDKLRSTLRNVLNVLTTVDRLHASAVGATSLVGKPQIKEEKSNQTPTTANPRSSSLLSSKSHSVPLLTMAMPTKQTNRTVHDWLIKKSSSSVQPSEITSVLDTPRDKGRLARLRRDPSVASLLDIYETDGTLKTTAFSNSPPVQRYHGPIISQKDKKTFGPAAEPRVGHKNKEPPVLSDSSPDWPRPKRTSTLVANISSSSDTTPNASIQAGMNTSLFVEMGSGGYIEDSSDESVSDPEMIHHRREAARRKLEGANTPVKASGHGDVDKIKSPNRRASEVFAFLDDGNEDADSSFEIGALEDEEEKYLIARVQAPHINTAREPEPDLGQSLLLSASMHQPGSSPSKRPLGPRDARGPLLVRPNPDPPASDLQKTSEKPARSPALDVGSSIADDSSAPLTGATFESDSFASQNTTDRSIYRGIYSYLKGTANLENTGRLASDGRKSSPDIIHETPARDEDNPFLATSLNIDKALPSTPSTESEADPFRSPVPQTPERRVGAFTPLPLFSPISPLDAGMTVHKFKIPRTPETPSPSKRPTNSIVRDRIARLEGTKPLKVEGVRAQKGALAWTPSTRMNEGKSYRLSSPSNLVKTRVKGLGDGRVFNAQGQKGLHRSMSSGKQVSMALPPNERITSSTSTNTGKSFNVVQPYPFCEDLFPAIFMPSGPTVAKTNNLLQTPQRRTSQNEPSPASSSKLGVYGREIMALARSKFTDSKAL